MLTNPTLGEGRLEINEPLGIVDTVHLRSVWDLGIAGTGITCVSIWVDGEQHCWIYDVGPVGDLVFKGAEGIPVETRHAVTEMAARTELRASDVDWYDCLLSGDPE